MNSTKACDGQHPICLSSFVWPQPRPVFMDISAQVFHFYAVTYPVEAVKHIVLLLRVERNGE